MRPVSDQQADQRWLSVALAQADKITGHSAENPAVGCAIIDADGRLIAVGHTSQGGRPHAEVNALAMAGEKAKGGTAYVTLEPCAHQGKTGPCAVALLKAGIRRVVIAAHDPDRRVAGKGIALLAQGGVEVSEMLSPRAERQMAGFLHHLRHNRPYVSVKMATSADGYIAADRSSQTWLTGPTSRHYVHDLRSRCDVMLTSSGTIAADDPSLNVRIAGYGFAQPPLAILDSEARLSAGAKCLAIERPVILYHRAGAKIGNLPAHVESVAIGTSDTGLDLVAVMADLQKRAYYHVMVEAGAQLFSSLHHAMLIDELVWLCAPHKLGAGVLAWDFDETMDFCAPNAYITSYKTALGADQMSVLHPIQR